MQQQREQPINKKSTIAEELVTGFTELADVFEVGGFMNVCPKCKSKSSIFSRESITFQCGSSMPFNSSISHQSDACRIAELGLQNAELTASLGATTALIEELKASNQQLTIALQLALNEIYHNEVQIDLLPPWARTVKNIKQCVETILQEALKRPTDASTK
jgi:hypothetical protein